MKLASTAIPKRKYKIKCHDLFKSEKNFCKISIWKLNFHGDFNAILEQKVGQFGTAPDGGRVFMPL